MAIAYLIHGYMGVGKTTLAKKLEIENNAIRFTHDEWMSKLYGFDPDAELFPYHYEKVLSLIDSLWVRCLELKVNVVLDLNFWTRKQRDNVRQKINELHAEYKLINVECSSDKALERIQSRNEQPNFNGLYISDNTYEILKKKFEPLQADEIFENVSTC